MKLCYLNYILYGFMKI